jgi:hypothetical protein
MALKKQDKIKIMDLLSAKKEAIEKSKWELARRNL